MLLVFAYSQESDYSLALALFLTFPRQRFLSDFLLMASEEGNECASDSV